MKILALLGACAFMLLGGCAAATEKATEPAHGEASQNPWVDGQWEWRAGYYDHRGNYVMGHYVRVNR